MKAQNEAQALLVYTKTVDSVKGALWLASRTPNILCYLPLSNSGKMASGGVHPYEVNNFFVVYIISLF